MAYPSSARLVLVSRLTYLLRNSRVRSNCSCVIPFPFANGESEVGWWRQALKDSGSERTRQVPGRALPGPRGRPRLAGPCVGVVGATAVPERPGAVLPLD